MDANQTLAHFFGEVVEIKNAQVMQNIQDSKVPADGIIAPVAEVHSAPHTKFTESEIRKRLSDRATQIDGLLKNLTAVAQPDANGNRFVAMRLEDISAEGDFGYLEFQAGLGHSADSHYLELSAVFDEQYRLDTTAHCPAPEDPLIRITFYSNSGVDDCVVSLSRGPEDGKTPQNPREYRAEAFKDDARAINFFCEKLKEFWASKYRFIPAAYSPA